MIFGKQAFELNKNNSTLSTIYLLCYVAGGAKCNPDAKRLFDDLLSSYNKLVRPVMNVTDAVTVKFKLKLSQLIDVVRIATTTTFCSNSSGSQESFNLHTNWFVLELGPPPPNEFRKRTYRNRKIQYAVDKNKYSSDVRAWSGKGQVVLPLRFMSEARWAMLTQLLSLTLWKLVWTLLRALALEHGEIPKMLFIFKSKSDHVTVQQ